MNKNVFLRYWQSVRQLTLKLLDEFPREAFDFRPAPEVMTVSQLFKHILKVEIYIRNGFLKDEWDTPDELGSNMFEKELLRDRLKIENQKTIQLLADIPDGRFMNIRETPFGKISGEILLMVAIDEEIHHRGNLYTYLRCLGKVPPQMRQNLEEILKENNDV